jgi:hypothetical protein
MIIVAKHRNGATGEITLRFIRNYARFEDLESTMISQQQSFGMSPNTIFENQGNFRTVPSKLNDMEDDADMSTDGEPTF